jgi:hypothetical protein
MDRICADGDFDRSSGSSFPVVAPGVRFKLFAIFLTPALDRAITFRSLHLLSTMRAARAFYLLANCFSPDRLADTWLAARAAFLPSISF